MAHRICSPQRILQIGDLFLPDFANQVTPTPFVASSVPCSQQPFLSSPIDLPPNPADKCTSYEHRSPRAAVWDPTVLV